MGQAKQRGSFEQRQAVAIERNKVTAQAEKDRREGRKRLQREAEMALPPEVRERRRAARFQMQAKIAILVGLDAGFAIKPEGDKP